MTIKERGFQTKETSSAKAIRQESACPFEGQKAVCLGMLRQFDEGNNGPFIKWSWITGYPCVKE